MMRPENAVAAVPCGITRGRANFQPAVIGLMAIIGCSSVAAEPLNAQFSAEAVRPAPAHFSGVDHANNPHGRLLNQQVGYLWNPDLPVHSATLVALGGARTTRVEFPGYDVMLRQSTAGLIGGLAGALAILLPLAAVDRGGSGVSDDAMTVGALLGYLGGSAVGVQYYSNGQGMSGSWWGTLGGSALGFLGGPVLVVTVPIGAMAGFNLTREE